MVLRLGVVAAVWAVVLGLAAGAASGAPKKAEPDARLVQFLGGLPQVDRAEVSVLGARVLFGDAARTPDGGTGLKPFPILPWREFAVVRAQRTLDDKGAAQLALLWRQQKFVPASADKSCHKPAHGIRFWAKDTLVLETSLSWECKTFYVPHLHEWTWHGLDTQTPQARELINFVVGLIPAPPP
jgi:hypothetical protein